MPLLPQRPFQAPRRWDVHQRRQHLSPGPGGQRIRVLAEIWTSEKRVGSLPTPQYYWQDERRPKNKEIKRERERINHCCRINTLTTINSISDIPCVLFFEVVVLIKRHEIQMQFIDILSRSVKLKCVRIFGWVATSPHSIHSILQHSSNSHKSYICECLDTCRLLYLWWYLWVPRHM